ncbi:hypothetical protein [Marinobacter sp. AC-23]|nr:hypothetical protein [Marinobacter sp. AC-23]
MTEHDDLDMQIAEFVLGTLPAGERKASRPGASWTPLWMREFCNGKSS